MKCLEIFTHRGEISYKLRGKKDFFLLSFPRHPAEIFPVNVDLLLGVFICLIFRWRDFFFFQLRFLLFKDEVL